MDREDVETSFYVGWLHDPGGETGGWANLQLPISSVRQLA